uniref:Phosphatidylinositol glycan anchor biosynthesis, class F n=1 Tax=Gasterosteus aculeatus aculeatus TaxID=481459 RepID=G3NE76_GASAC
NQSHGVHSRHHRRLCVHGDRRPCGARARLLGVRHAPAVALRGVRCGRRGQRRRLLAARHLAAHQEAHAGLSRLFRSCVYFFLSCLFFHAVVVLYGAPLIESALETFSLAVLLTSLTTLRCLCVLGPNVQAWIRVFSRHGAMSVWDTCLQITVACTLVGAWVGAFPIPLDWDRPWQVWPVSCSLGATIGFLTGLVAAPAWIHYHRKQLTYKCK